jgi:ABC-type transporter Mla MlaB component
VGASFGLGDLPGLCDRVREALGERPPTAVTCDLAGIADPDVGTVDALARLMLAANRRGCDVSLRNAPTELRELLALIGLEEVVRCDADSDLEPRREPEGGEEAAGVQEERDPADPPI